MLGVKLRVPGALGVKLGAGLLRIGLGARLIGGLNEGRELMEGPGGIDGVGAGRLNDGLGLGRLKDGLGRLNDGLRWLNDGLGRLNDGLGWLTDGLDRLALIDGPGLLENDRCWKLDARFPTELPDLSRPSSRLLAIGETNTATATAATTARDRPLLVLFRVETGHRGDGIIFFFNILPLLGSPDATATSGTPYSRLPTLQPIPQVGLTPHIILLFSRL